MTIFRFAGPPCLSADRWRWSSDRRASKLIGEAGRENEAKAFYDALLALANLDPLFDHPSGGRVYGRDGVFTFAVLGPFDGQPATVGNGAMFAVSFDARAGVDAFHARALELGGVCEGPPVLTR